MRRELKKQKQDAGKRIVPPPEVPLGKRRPVFGLQYMAGCFDGCHKDEKLAFVEKLYRLSQMTWNEIESSGRHKMGFEWMPQAQIIVPIPSHLTEEAKIMVFRYNGMKPMLGYRDGFSYYPFWLDTDFTAYPH